MSEPSRVFVTGAAGFIGRHLTALLQRRGYAVTALVRAAPATPLSGCRTVIGDVCLPETYRDALRGCDALIHLAAMYRLGPVDRQAMRRVNVSGTRTVVDAAQEAGVARVVHVSSTAALGETHGAEPDESHRHNGHFRSFYEETKHIAHGLAATRARAGAPIILAIPGGVFGPGDTSALAAALRGFIDGKLPFQVATKSRFNLCPVDAACDGLLRILKHGAPGESWLLTGANLSMPELLDEVARHARAHGRDLHPPRAVSPRLLAPAARILDTIARVTGATMPLSREALAVMDGSTYTYSSACAQTTLEWNPGDFSAALSAYVANLLTASAAG